MLSTHHWSWILWVPPQLNFQGCLPQPGTCRRRRRRQEQCPAAWGGLSRAVLFLLFHLLTSLSFSAVSHTEGKFRFELSKLMIVAKTPRDEL